MGKPSIMHVVYDKADNSPDAKAFKTFFDKVAAGEIKRGDAGDIVRTQTSTDVRNIEKKKNESRTVLSFKDFKNV
jgi:sulfate adenylyltransferase subunit 1 (EFTu-like GTPase family)